MLGEQPIEILTRLALVNVSVTDYTWRNYKSCD